MARPSPETRFTPVANPTQCGDCPIRRQALFRSVPSQLLDWSAQFRRQQLVIPAREYIYMEGEKTPYVYTLFSGWVKLVKTLYDGKSQIIRFGLPGDFLGFQSNLSGPMNHTVKALTDVTVCCFPRDEFDLLFRQSPEVSAELAWLSARDMALCHEHLVNAACKTAYQRIAHLLLELYYRSVDVPVQHADAIDVPVTQEDIAESTGLTSVHVSRTLKQLREDGLMTCHRQKLQILDLEKALAVTRFDPGVLIRPIF